MIGMKSHSSFDVKGLRDKARKGTFRSLAHAGAAVRLTARRSIKKNPRPSAAGHPPHTRKGQLKRALLYKVEKERRRVVIGPAYSVVGLAGHAHEFGGKFRREDYPKRPYMGPALKSAESRIPKIWSDSIR